MRFRKWCRDDIDYAIGLWGDFKVTNLFDNRGQLNDRQVLGRLLQEIENQEKYGVQYWPIFSRSEAMHVGAAGLRPKDLRENQYEIGFHICSKYWNMGFGLDKGEVEKDDEGVSTMKGLGENMAWLLKKIHA